MLKEARCYQSEAGQKVRCNLCPHNCLIADGKDGLCRVRGNRSGKLYALTYGRVVSAAVDPIEKKPLYHFYPGAPTLSLGSIGCNLHCLHCQNWQISQCDMGQGDRMLSELLPAGAVTETRSVGAEILVFTFNEPSLWFEYILDCAELAIPAGLKLVMVTSGMINPKPLQELLNVVAAYRVDIKGFSGEFYKNLTGFDVLDQVLENTRTAFRQGVHVEIVTNLIPGWNDDETQLKGLATWIRDELSPAVPWHVTRYIPCHRLNAPMTPVDRLELAERIGRETGLQHIYVGNVHGHSAQDTHCAGCGALMIERSGYTLRQNRLIAGCCPDCKERLLVYRDAQTR
jgi:pyruvate formate lyase activating enzyme